MTRVKKELPKKTSELTEDVVIEVEATVELTEAQNTTLKELRPQKQQQIIDQNAQAETQAETIEEPVDPALYFFNRELSWVAFNKRVLNEGIDPRTPLLERAKFCAIFSTNLDEFFMVRVAGLKRRVDTGLAVTSSSGLEPNEVLTQISKLAHTLQQRHSALFINEIEPALEQSRINITQWDKLELTEQEQLTDYYRKQIFPVLTPLAVDPAHPFPYISGLSLNIAVMIAHPENGSRLFARVKVPPTLPRFIRVPGSSSGVKFITIEEVMGQHLQTLFEGMTILQFHNFRVTRNEDLDVD
jgi:polyphosphate kinase